MLRTAAMVGGLALVNRKYLYKRFKGALWRKRNSLYNYGVAGAATLAEKLMAQKRLRYRTTRGHRRRTRSVSHKRRRLSSSPRRRSRSVSAVRSISSGASSNAMMHRGRSMTRSGAHRTTSLSLYRPRHREPLQDFGAQPGWGGRVHVRRRGVHNVFDSYNKLGCVQVRETTGSVTDKDSVYVMNEAINARDCIFNMIAAVFRKLFEKAGLRINGYNASVVSITSGDANVTPYTVNVVTQNNITGVSFANPYQILAADSFGTVVNAFVQLFEEYSAGYGRFNVGNSVEPYKVVFWQGASNATSPVVLSELLFNETFVSVFSRSELKVQNRSVATGGSTDAENIANTPLQGRVYEFRGVPKPKANGFDVGGTNPAVYPFERIHYPEGGGHFGGNTGGMSTDMKEPPMPQFFWNCFKAGGIRLEPGEIKGFKVYAHKKGNFLKILKSIRLQMYQVGAPYTNYSVFPVQMIGLEDVLNANSVESIAVQYEIQRTLGVKCWTRQKKYYRTQFITDAD